MSRLNAKKSYRVPFDADGNLMHYAVETKGYTLYKAAVWKAPIRRSMELFIDRLVTGRSAKYTLWHDEEGHQYPMFSTDLLDLVKRGYIDNGRTVGIFIPVKRGQNYGIKLC